MRGRKTTPTALKQLHGNPGKRALPKAEPKPPPANGAIGAPPHLTVEAKREWARKVTDLRASGLLTTVDLGLLAAYCSAHGSFVEAGRKLKKMGEVIEGRDGNLVRNPWGLIRNKAVEQMVRIGSEFGFSPASRPRLGRAASLPDGDVNDRTSAAAATPTSGLDAYLAGHPDAKAVH